MTRDGQRKKVYEAENILARMYDRAVESGNPVVSVNGVTVTLPPEAKFGCVNSIQAYINRVLALPAVRQAFPALSLSVPTVRHRQGTTKAHYQMGTIAIPTDRAGNWAMRELVILHELAHHLSPGAQHGATFAAAELTLFGIVLGPEVELLARMLFADGGVDTKPVRGPLAGFGA